MSSGPDIFGLEGDVAIVTGALGNLGPVFCEALLERGAKVLATDVQGREPSPRFRAVRERFSDAKLVTTVMNITSRDELSSALATCKTKLGAPTVLVNNAGIDQPPRVVETHRLEDIPVELARAVFEVNALGTFQAMQVFGSEMAARGAGSIINIGSAYATAAPDPRYYDHLPCEPPFLKPPAYGASKAAVLNLTRYFAVHLATRGVRVNALSPGHVSGDQDATFKAKIRARIPLGAQAEPEDLKGALIFLASDASRYVTGVNLDVAGGFHLW
jgi:NAD(P)-dependent dehydrogenase (short-subunit alcohol dehydrogenase family)